MVCGQPCDSSTGRSSPAFTGAVGVLRGIWMPRVCFSGEKKSVCSLRGEEQVSMTWLCVSVLSFPGKQCSLAVRRLSRVLARTLRDVGQFNFIGDSVFSLEN